MPKHTAAPATAADHERRVVVSIPDRMLALIDGGRRILSNVVASQVALHAPSGGIVPELAARAHLRWIVPSLDEAWDAAVGPCIGRVGCDVKDAQRPFPMTVL